MMKWHVILAWIILAIKSAEFAEAGALSGVKVVFSRLVSDLLFDKSLND